MNEVMKLPCTTYRLKLSCPSILDMGRVTHVCATCAEHFTRKYSATRHNITVHGNRGEIVPLLEYLVGRYSGRIPASNPFWYSGRHSKKTASMILGVLLQLDQTTWEILLTLEAGKGNTTNSG